MTLWYPHPSQVPSLPHGSVQPAPPKTTTHRFTAYTESLTVTGTASGAERLSDLLNRREPIRMTGASVTPHAARRVSKGRQSEIILDPFDIEIALGSPEDSWTTEQRVARPFFKARYPVLVLTPTFQVRGTLHVFPGSSPEYEISHTRALFMPVTDAKVRRMGRLVNLSGNDVVLVNTRVVTRVQQLDADLLQ
jgi:hypothetical protein